ncbi:MAG: response regulator [candidate division NC10 bacterium]|nr:response regulator [candidate division NC10 bacterium]
MEKPKILVVDDEPQALELLKAFLQIKGYAVMTASSGAEALTVLEERRPHLILLDVMMPGMDGLETLRRIRERDQAVGILMITAANDEEIAKKAVRQGAYDYITKPIDLAYLELAILTRLAKS